MTTNEKGARRARRDITDEFRADVVARCRTSDRTIAQVSRDFDLTP
ncbi:MAG: hypothetical protein M0T79_03065 [Actinomycetota bacterium]|nr:hypothetical protein [Actinomycetota bacterium]